MADKDSVDLWIAKIERSQFEEKNMGSLLEDAVDTGAVAHPTRYAHKPLERLTEEGPLKYKYSRDLPVWEDSVDLGAEVSS